MTIKTGCLVGPHQSSIEQIITAAQQAEALGVDSLWTSDHMFPPYGNPEGTIYEAYTLLGALARETNRATLGCLVCGNSYRNPELLAYMTGTLDHLSGGRAVLGVGSGWMERDYREYGYELGTAASRLQDLEKALPRIKSRLGKLNPQLIGKVPIMIGGGGEKVTLRLVAQYADIWNGFGPPEEFQRKNAILDQWCESVSRDPAQIERTCLIPGLDLSEKEEVAQTHKYIAAGVQHLILELAAPYDMELLQRLIDKVKEQESE